MRAVCVRIAEVPMSAPMVRNVTKGRLEISFCSHLMVRYFCVLSCVRVLAPALAAAVGERSLECENSER